VVRSGQTIEQLEAQLIRSDEKLKELQVHAERMEANNDLLRESLKEQKEKFDAYKKDVESANPRESLCLASSLTFRIERAQQEDEQRLKTLEEDLGVSLAIVYYLDKD
jgi:predicted nuclease with TOPRIM domain